MLLKTVIVYILNIIPYTILLILSYELNWEAIRDIITILVLVQLVLCVPLSKFFIYWISRDLRDMREFVQALHEKNFFQDLSLPDQKDDEGDLVCLKRELNALGRVMASHRQKVEHYFSTANKKALRYKQMAHIDPLTKLYNRRAFEHELDSILHIDRKNVFYLLLLDLDDFKPVNDTYGHNVGDDVLILAGKIIKKCIREDIDFPFRYGGDEFGIILNNNNYDEVFKIADRIKREFIKNNSYGVGVSIGGVKIQNDLKNITPRAVFSLADEALYQSKEKKYIKCKESDKIIILDNKEYEDILCA